MLSVCEKYCNAHLFLFIVQKNTLTPNVDGEEVESRSKCGHGAADVEDGHQLGVHDAQPVPHADTDELLQDTRRHHRKLPPGGNTARF